MPHDPHPEPDDLRQRVLEVLVDALAPDAPAAGSTAATPTAARPTAAAGGPSAQAPAGGSSENAWATRIVLRPMANPLSLGFLGLFFATTLLSGLELGWVPPDDGRTLAIAILAFTVPVQLIASIFGFLTRDLVTATAMGVLAGTWAATAMTTLLAAPGTHSPALGLILATAAAAICMPAVAAAQSKLLAAAVTLGTAARWAITAAYEVGGSATVETAAGAMGLALAALALYGSLAFELEGQHRRTVLPTFRRGAGAEAMTGDLADQVGRAEHEAGVREQL